MVPSPHLNAFYPLPEQIFFAGIRNILEGKVMALERHFYTTINRCHFAFLCQPDGKEMQLAVKKIRTTPVCLSKLFGIQGGFTFFSNLWAHYNIWWPQHIMTPFQITLQTHSFLSGPKLYFPAESGLAEKWEHSGERERERERKSGIIC